MEIVRNARLVIGNSLVDDGWVAWEDGVIAEVGSTPRPSGTDLGGRLLTAGLVDMHMHGAMGHSFNSANREASSAIVDYHRHSGSTSVVCGITSDQQPCMIGSAAAISELIDCSGVLGTFFEGPFLSPIRKGAHRNEDLLPPDAALCRRLLEACRPGVKMVAIAPELPGGFDLIREARQAGAIPTLGHTDASFEESRHAFDLGIVVATHLFNGMRQIHHRDPGPALAALADERVTCELIVDGFHLSDRMVEYVFQTIGSGRVALVTDSSVATGLGDGVYRHGDVALDVRDGRAMLADGTSLAGSTLTMARAVRHAVHDAGVPLCDAITAATITPARTLGVHGAIGSIEPGKRADLLVLDTDLSVAGVVAGGSWQVPIHA